MVKYCLICDREIKHGDRVLVGIVTNFIQLQSGTTWAVEKPEKFTFVNHATCEELE